MAKKKQKSALKKDDLYYRIHPLILDLKSKNGVVREKAREELVAIGSPAVSHLAELIDQPASILRWEAVKALGQIADPVSVPLFIAALYDKDEEVRWLAAEGLIAVGAHATGPLLQELVKNSKSVLLRKGAHHYFSEMRELDGPPRFNDLLSALEGEDAELNAPIVAEKLLHDMNFKN
jgi:HEAT repeat protein